MKRVLGVIAGVLVLLLVAVIGAWWWIVSNVETPEYETLAGDGAFELRAYPELIVAEVTTAGSRDEAVRAGFRPLAGYIFARERDGEKIAMTAPVTQSRSEGESWTVQFVMPSEYGLGDLPKPSGGEVSLERWPARQRAAVRFSGVADDELIAEKERVLREWMRERGLMPEGGAIYAYYNDPMTPGPLRRNEVLFDILPVK